MGISRVFKRALFFSLAGHLAVFGVFSFSFGTRLPRLDASAVSFWGATLTPAEVIPLPRAASGLLRQLGRRPPVKVTPQEGISMESGAHYLKPLLALPESGERTVFLPPSPLSAVSVKRKEPVLMFYPRLPYHLGLYFKDRQAVHIELLFAVVPANFKKKLVVKRSISSGNLEVDLLSARYISRYLSTQRAEFLPRTWQKVEIDLDLSSRDKR